MEKVIALPDNTETSRLIRFFESQGFYICGMLGGKCPYQIDLYHRGLDLYIYFRSRGYFAGIEVYSISEESSLALTYDLPDSKHLAYETYAQFWPTGSFEAGYISHGEALAIFQNLWSDIKDYVLD